MSSLKEYFLFIRREWKLLFFGLACTFFSSFGQTFLIALFVPELQDKFDLSRTAFGTLYASATIVSAFLVAYVGRFLDHYDGRTFALINIVLMALSVFLLGFGFSVILIFLALLGLRFTGQGMMAHIAMTVISRNFSAERGRALSFTILGYAFGEGLLPAMVGFLLISYGLSSSSLVLVFLILITYGFILIITVRDGEKKAKSQFNGENRKSDLKTESLSERIVYSAKESRYKNTLDFFKEEKFYLISFVSFILPFAATGFLFYQLSLAEERNWSVEWVTGSFISYAIFRVLGTLISGSVVDRFTATFIFPFFLFPFLFSLFALIVSSNLWTLPVFFAGMGFSMGMSATVKNGVVAEHYPLHLLGSIKSLYLSLMVLSTAVSPPLYGWMLDYGLDFSGLAWFTIGLTALAIIWSFRILNKEPIRQRE